jgi:hypothetical protein
MIHSLPLALSLSDPLIKIGALVAFAAIVGIAVLSLLFFAQARELRRLREWVEQAPERAAELEHRIGAATTARIHRAVGQMARPVAQPAARAAAASPATQIAPQATAAATGEAAAGLLPAAPAVIAGNAPAPAPAEVAPAPSPPAVAGRAAAAAVAVSTAAPAEPEGLAQPMAAAGDSGDRAWEPDAAPVAVVAAPAAPSAPQAAAPPRAPAPPPPRPARAARATPVEGRRGAPERPAASVRNSPPPPVSAGRSRPARGAQRRGARRGGPPPGPPFLREERSPARATALIVVGVLVGVVVLVLALTSLGGGSSAPKGSTATLSSASPPAGARHTTSTGSGGGNGGGEASLPAANPSETHVVVLNSTETTGLARRLSSNLQQSGYTLAAASAARPSEARSTSVVEYASGHRVDAQHVAQTLGIAQVQPLGSSITALAGSATVVVIAGADQASVP